MHSRHSTTFWNTISTYEMAFGTTFFFEFLVGKTVSSNFWSEIDFGCISENFRGFLINWCLAIRPKKGSDTAFARANFFIRNLLEWSKMHPKSSLQSEIREKVHPNAIAALEYQIKNISFNLDTFFATVESLL